MNSQQQQLNELNRHLRIFLSSSTVIPQFNSANIKSALYLIQNLPSSRLLVLDYFGAFFKFVTHLAKKPEDAHHININFFNDCIDEIQQVLINLMRNDAWSSELFDWAIEVTALSVINLEKQLPPQQASITDLLHNWAQCKPLRALLEIPQIFITNNKNKQEVIQKFLNLHNKYASNANWILCHLGSLCAEEMIFNFLVHGFKEFISQHIQPTAASIKFSSIMSILNHFTTLYSHYVRYLFEQIFQSYLKGDYEYFKNNFSLNSDQVKQYTIMYLIHLASLSTNIFYIMSYNVKETLSHSVLENIYLQSKQILSHESRNSIFISLKSLLRQLTNNSYEYLIYLINFSIDNQLDEDTRRTIKFFITSFLDDLKSFTFTNSKEPIPIIESLKKDFKLILNDLLSDLSSSNDFKRKCLFNLVVLIGIQGPSYITNSIMSRMLVIKHNDINTLIKYRQEIDTFDTNCTSQSIEAIIKVLNSNKNHYCNDQIYVNDQIGIDLSLNESVLENFLFNLLELHEWDCKNEHSGYNIDKILSKSDLFLHLMSLLDVKFPSIIHFFNKIGIPDKLTVDQCVHLAVNLIKYFFHVIEIENDRGKQNCELEIVKQMIQTSCLKYNELIRSIFLRTLINYFFDQTSLYNFNAKKPVLNDRNNNSNHTGEGNDFDCYYDSNSEKYVSLYEQNIALSKHLPLTKLSAKVPLVENFNRNPSKLADRQEKLSLLNIEFMEIIDLICSSPASTISQGGRSTKIINTNLNYNLDLLNSLALLIVEKLNLSYIDYQWPDIENFKLYIERDVKVQNIIEESPVCWMLLNFVANNHQAFCKCLPVLKSLLASLIVQWENVKEQPTRNLPKLLELTIKLLNLVNKAQLLPTPLCYLIDIISLINSYETHVLLTIIWKYLKTIFQPCSPATTKPLQTAIVQHKPIERQLIDQLRIIFQRNIQKLAHFYVKFFKDSISIAAATNAALPVVQKIEGELVVIN